MAIALAAFSFGGVSLADNVAQINNTTYETLTSAISSANNGDTVVLLDDVTTSISLTTNKSITLNLNGHKITKNSTAVSISTWTLTVEWNWLIDVTSTGWNVFSVRSWWKLIVKNWIFTWGGWVYVNWEWSEATIKDWSFVWLRDWNSALMHAANKGKITILTGYFKWAPTGGKPQKVIYAWANSNLCNTYWSGSTAWWESNLNLVPWEIIVEWWTLIGRISLSNNWKYKIKWWTFTLYWNITAGVGCNYYNCDKDKKDPSSCQDVTGIVSILWEWYVGIPEGTNSDGSIYRVIYDPVATIWVNGYSTVTWAIAAATDGAVVEILKAWTYTLPRISKAITIKKWDNVGWNVVFEHSVTSSFIIAMIDKSVIFEWIRFKLNGNWGDATHYFNTTQSEPNITITFNNCVVDWTLYVNTNEAKMIFNNCNFIKENATSPNAYNLQILAWNADFNNCTFINNNGCNVNIGIAVSSISNEYAVNFINTKFKQAWDADKSAIVLNEAANGLSHVNLVVNNPTILDWSIDYPTKWLWNSKFIQINRIIKQDLSIQNKPEWEKIDTYGILWTTNWWEVVAKLDWTTIYSTPKIGGEYTVKFDWVASENKVKDGYKVSKPADPSRNCYRFNWWYNGNVAYDFNAVVTSDLTLTSSWTYTCGWWSSSSSSSSSNTSNKTWSNNTWNVNTWTNNTWTVNTWTVDTWTNNEETVNQEELKNPEQQDWYDNNWDQQEILENGLTREMNNAYEFAYRAGITTMETIEDAQMEEWLTRIAMAKMLSQYAINVLGKTPADVEVPEFVDVPAELDAEYDNGVSKAYKLWIMWKNMPDNKFLPFDFVTRAQFGTALSRLLFGIEDGEDAYYTTHLAKLKEAWIISNDDPSLEELRWYVMLMLMRSAK